MDRLPTRITREISESAFPGSVTCSITDVE
jgi:hypothetical protein